MEERLFLILELVVLFLLISSLRPMLTGRTIAPMGAENTKETENFRILTECIEANGSVAIDEEIKFGLITDVHYGSESFRFPPSNKKRKVLENITAEMDTQDLNFIIQDGDLADAWCGFFGGQGTVPHDKYLQWYSDATKWIASNVSAPFYGVLGNHELNEVSCGSLNKAELLKVFREQGGIFPNPNYSFNKKGIKFIVLQQPVTSCPWPRSTDHSYPRGELKWLNETIRESEDPIVVFEHVPSIEDPDSYDTVKREDQIRQIFRNDKVIAIFVGHMHHDKPYSFLAERDGVRYFHTPTPYFPKQSWTKVELKPGNRTQIVMKIYYKPRKGYKSN